MQKICCEIFSRVSVENFYIFQSIFIKYWFFCYSTKVIFLSNHPFQAFLVSKTSIFIHVNQKLRGSGGGGGGKALAKNEIFFMGKRGKGFFSPPPPNNKKNNRRMSVASTILISCFDAGSSDLMHNK